MGRLKVFAYCTHSLQTIKTRHNYFVWNISKTVDRLSAACRLTVGQQTADSRPTTDNWPTVAHSWPTVCRQKDNSRPTVGRQTSDIFWEQFFTFTNLTIQIINCVCLHENFMVFSSLLFRGAPGNEAYWPAIDWLIDWFSDWCVRRLRQIMKIVWKSEERQNVSCLDDSYPCPLMLRLKHPSLSQPSESAPHWKHKRQQENLTTKQVSSS